MAKQTAVEWLCMQLLDFDNHKIWPSLLKRAKNMEKDQIMKAVYDGMGTNFDPNMGRAEQYYKEIYENNK